MSKVCISCQVAFLSPMSMNSVLDELRDGIGSHPGRDLLKGIL